MEKASWTCPFCNRDTTIGDDDTDIFRGYNRVASIDGYKILVGKFIVCPNPKCKKLTLSVDLFKGKKDPYEITNTGIKMNSWNLIPDSHAKPYPTSIVPLAIYMDYAEACRIMNLSPKSSATLSRRCIQGMIRDFWSVAKPESYKGHWSLINEINSIKNKIDPDIWTAIDAVRKIGNIGAHMEQNVNIIIDVEPKEAEKLIELIELLIEEWYINRYRRQQRLADVTEIGKVKTRKKDLEVRQDG